MSDPVIPAREVFRNFPGVLIALFYIAATLTMAVSGWGVWLRLRRYLRGRSVSRWDALGRRLFRAGLAVGAHTTLGKRNAAVGLAHAGIFWGFVAWASPTAALRLPRVVWAPTAKPVRKSRRPRASQRETERPRR